MGRSSIGETLLGNQEGYEQAQVFMSFSGFKNRNLQSLRVPALVIGDFSISTGAAWNTPLVSSALESMSQTLNIAKGAAEALAQKAGYNIDFGAQVQLKSLKQTANFWTGSERPVFSLELLYISLYRGFDVRQQVLQMYQTVMPTLGKDVAGLGFLLNAPLGYNPITGAGTFSIQLGTWFRARAQVMKSVQFTYSQEMVPLDGGKGIEPSKFAPLYAKGSITFEPYQDITYGDFKGYFLGVD